MTTAVLHSRDDDGRLVVGVPLNNRPGQRAWLYATDYEAIVNDYGTTPWFVNDNGSGQLYVRLQSHDRRNLVMVSHLIIADPLTRRVRYRDGDRLNLRSRNLAGIKARPVSPRVSGRVSPAGSRDRAPQPVPR